MHPCGKERGRALKQKGSARGECQRRVHPSLCTLAAAHAPHATPPRQVSGFMQRVLSKLQAQANGKWVGSNAVHLGDNDTPNALVWMDKYTQAPCTSNARVLHAQCMRSACTCACHMHMCTT